MEPDVGEFEDDDFDVLAYVLSINLHRRHLTTSQRAMVAAKLKELYAAEAKERQKQSQGRGKKGMENLPYLNGRASDAAEAKERQKQKPKSVVENLPQQNGTARDKAGKGDDGSGGRGNKKNPSENFREGLGRASDAAGKALSVSGRTVADSPRAANTSP